MKIILLVFLIINLSACSTWRDLDNSDRGAIIGGGTGAVIGNSVSPGVGGTLIGGAAGAVGGAFIGKVVDKDKK